MTDLPHLIDASISAGDRVFVRIDCNVPLEGSVITDDFRLVSVAPTLKYLSDKGARIIIAGAIGRPGGVRDEALTTQPISQYFSEHNIVSSQYLNDCVGPYVRKHIDACEPGSAVVLENLRFYKEEESNDDSFARDLADLADLYVNDAFGQSHRKQASIVAITQHLPSYSGMCLEKEVTALDSVLETGQAPVVAIIGGAKVSDKLGVIEALLDRCDSIIIGGAMAYTFLKGRGDAIGKSLCEDEFVDKTRSWMKTGKIVLPVDSVIAPSIDSTETSVTSEIDNDYAGFDIGPESSDLFSSIIQSANTVLWNGPMGVFEKEQFAQGTRAVSQAVATCEGFTLVGGGDSVAAIRSYGLESSIDHVSTGGGATLEYIESGSLVGVDALTANNIKE